MPIILPYIEDRPRLTLELLSKRGKKWRVFSVLIDSGADFSIFPSIAAQVLGIKFHHARKIEDLPSPSVFQQKQMFFRCLAGRLFSRLLGLNLTNVQRKQSFELTNNINIHFSDSMVRKKTLFGHSFA